MSNDNNKQVPVPLCECAANYRYDNLFGKCTGEGKKFKFTIKENFTIDVDECAEKRHNCDLTTSVCKNVPGSYECHCLPGLEGTGDICIGKISERVHKTEKLILKLLDIDECQRGIAKCHGNLLNV